MIILETERLKIRHFLEKDIDALCDLFSDAETMRFIGSRQPMNCEETKKWFNEQLELQDKGITRFAVSLKDSNELVGVSGIQLQNDVWDFGYYFLKKYWGNGYAFESCREILSYIERSIGIQDYQIFIAKENTASIRLIKKLGFCPEEIIIKDGETGNYYKPCRNSLHSTCSTGV